MKKLKQLSGKEVVRIFELHGFEIKRSLGSHTRLTLKQEDTSYHVTIPLHTPLKRGTLHGIVKDFEICLGRELAEEYFFTT